MKKIFKVFGALLAFAMVIGLSSCGDMLNGTQNNGKDDAMDYSQPINHTFKKDSTDTGYFVCHYNAQNTFSYQGHDNCYYQMEFTSSTPKKFTLYSRTKKSTNVLETIARGTFTGDPWKEGDVVLTVTEGNSAFQTISIKKDAEGTLYFVGDVAASHKYIGAKDDK